MFKTVVLDVVHNIIKLPHTPFFLVQIQSALLVSGAGGSLDAGHAVERC